MKPSLIIKNLVPSLAERGKIKIGEKGTMIRSAKGTDFQPPRKLDYFRVTTLERGPDGNYITDREVHALYGEKPRELPIRLLYDDIALNFQSRYTCFMGRSLWCYGDGEVAVRGEDRDEVPCPCERQDPLYAGPEPCKISARLICLIQGVERIGGCWSLRTTSYNSTVSIMSSLALIQRITGGPLAGIPLMLTLSPKTVVTPKTGQTQVVWVVSIEYRGTVEELQAIGYEKAKAAALHYARINQIEEEARRLLVHDPLHLASASREEIDEYVEEFVPEQAIKSANIDQEGEKDGHNDHNKTAAYPVKGSDSHGTPRRTGGDESRDGKIIDDQEPRPKPHGRDNEQDGADSSAHKNETRSAGARRRRTKFTVDPQQWDGQTELITCGSTPDQLLRIQELVRKSADAKQVVTEFLASIGQDRLSFLRADEAEALIAEISAEPVVDVSPEPTPPAQEEAGDPMVDCPMGDKIRLSHCLNTCRTRKKDGFCPVVDQIPDQF